jgi:hypothetical protein
VSLKKAEMNNAVSFSPAFWRCKESVNDVSPTVIRKETARALEKHASRAVLA